MDYAFIEIDKDLLPYNFEIILKNWANQEVLYSMDVNYNVSGDFFTFTLYYEGEILVENEKLVLGQPLFKFLSQDKDLNMDDRFPQDVIIPMSLTGNIGKVDYENINKSVYIFIVNRQVLI